MVNRGDRSDEILCRTVSFPDVVGAPLIGRWEIPVDFLQLQIEGIAELPEGVVYINYRYLAQSYRFSDHLYAETSNRPFLVFSLMARPSLPFERLQQLFRQPSRLLARSGTGQRYLGIHEHLSIGNANHLLLQGAGCSGNLLHCRIDS